MKKASARHYETGINNEADFVNYPGLVVENWVNSH
jgi:hypothetical protein